MATRQKPKDQSELPTNALTARQRDENLLIVVATEQYALKYGLSTSATFELFKQYEIANLIRKHYNALHTQPLDESFHFADDVLKRRLNNLK